MATEVVYTNDFGDWWEGLTQSEQEAVDLHVGLLQERGATLGYPYSSQIRGSRHALRELRPQTAGKPLRVFYAFDPARQAVLLIAGDKTGRDRFYEEMIPKAERIWEQYLLETGQ